MDIKETPMRVEQREKVIVEAWNAFTSQGIKNVRMDDIAGRLKMSKRTLYELFMDKETLLEECFLYNKEQNRKRLKQIMLESKDVLEVVLKCYKESLEVFRKTNKSFFEDMKKYPRIYAMLKENHEQENEVTIDFLKQGVSQGLFRPDTNFHIVHMLLSKQIELLMCAEDSGQFTFFEIYEAIIFTYLRGISTLKGIEELDKFIVQYRDEMQ